MRVRLAGPCLVVLLLAPACGAGPPAAAGPTASVTDPPTTADPLAAEKRAVEAAYLHSWDVYSSAVAGPDASRLAEVYADDALTLRRAEVDRLRSAGHAAKIDVDHHIDFAVVEPDHAELIDRYQNRSLLIDAVSRRPLEHDINEVVNRQYTLRRKGDQWFVTYVRGL